MKGVYALGAKSVDIVSMRWSLRVTAVVNKGVNKMRRKITILFEVRLRLF